MSETNGNVLTIERSETFATFAAAFVKAQRKIVNAKKDASNPHFNSKYADLASVDAAARPALNEFGIAVIQTPAPAQVGRMALTTMLLHESGEFISATGEIALGRGEGPQAYGSALTYARRYFLAAMTGVCPEDDDGNDAEGYRQEPKTTAKAIPAKPAAKPAKEPTPDESFKSDVLDLLKSAGIKGPNATGVINRIKEKYKVDSLIKLDNAQRSDLCANLANSEFIKQEIANAQL